MNFYNSLFVFTALHARRFDLIDSNLLKNRAQRRSKVFVLKSSSESNSVEDLKIEFEFKSRIKLSSLQKITGKTADSFKNTPNLVLGVEPSEEQILRSIFVMAIYINKLDKLWNSEETKILLLPPVPRELISEHVILCENSLDLIKTRINRVSRSVTQCHTGLLSKKNAKLKTLKVVTNSNSQKSYISPNRMISELDAIQIVSYLTESFKPFEFDKLELLRRATYFVDLIEANSAKDLTLLQLKKELLKSNFAEFGFTSSLVDFQIEKSEI